MEKELTKADITRMFARNTPRKVRRVDLPGEGFVYIRMLTLGDHNTRLEVAKQGRTSFNQVGYFIVASLCDKDGNLLYTDGQADEMDELPSVYANIIMAAIADFNGLSKESRDFFLSASNPTQNSNGSSAYANGSALPAAS